MRNPQDLAFTRGLHDLGHGLYAYLQPDGGWGWSNSGLITDADESLLVDTLFDAKLTREMLACMKDAAGVGGEDVNILVNTHANGDHCHGNGLCSHAEIIATEASAQEMSETPATFLAETMRKAPELGKVGKYLIDIFGSFDFDDVAERAPTTTFSGRYSVRVGAKEIEMQEVGPAHSRGDTLIHVPGDRTVFSGDILFIDSTPIMWDGPMSNWLEACEAIIAMNPEVIVPGHGPVTDIHGVRRVQDYLRYIDQEARKRFDAGLSVRDAAHDIALADFSAWGDAERIAVNVSTLYKEYEGDTSPMNIVELFGLMAELRGSR
jgi:glyoxylase-like metal-dependent hydrolase (beta-lactamase superfamily II)